MSKVAEKPQESRYERDFFAWTRAQAKALAEQRTELLDIPNLVDEVDSLGRNLRRALESHLTVLIVHLLKLSVQPERATPSWTLTIRNQRLAIEKLIRRSPSLRSYPEQIFMESYHDAVRLAADETALGEGAFSAEPTFTLSDLLDRSFFPK